jgi:hypothetical protein
MGGLATRRIEVGTDTCLLGFTGRGYIKSHAFDASTLSPTGGVNEQQVITVTGVPSGGNYKLKYRGQETAVIAHDAAASAVQTALRNLSNIGASDVSVAGDAGGPYTVTFAGALGNSDVFMIQLSDNDLTGGTTPSVTVAQTVMGTTYDPRIMVGTANLPGTIVTETGSNPTKVKEYTAAGGVAEEQTLTVTGTPTGGNVKLSYRGGVTGVIAHNAAAADVAAALNALDTIAEDGGVTATGGAHPGTPIVVTFNEHGVRPLIALNTNSYTGGTTPTLTPTETEAGADAEAIYGIIDGTEEFISNTSAGDRDVAVYLDHLNLDARKIKNFATHQAALEEWCAANNSHIRHA